MADDHIRYDILAQEALRGVMRKVLAEVARTGLPGNHHFFITFLTGAPGVRVSSRLRERYPEQMTIVIQFQYWDLKVTDTGFEVGLSFSDVPEKLEIPFSAVRGFYDPSVNFELEFDVKTDAQVEEEAAQPAPEPLTIVTEKKPKAEKKAAAEAEKKPAAAEAGAKGAEVVSLDAFRKNSSAVRAMADIVNLRQARKQKARDDKTRVAEQNRALHGRSKAQKQRDQLIADKAERFVGGHRLDPSGKDEQ